MPEPRNTWTVEAEDNHSNTVTVSGIAASGHVDALRTYVESNHEAALAALTSTDTWTFTVSQP